MKPAFFSERTSSEASMKRENIFPPIRPRSQLFCEAVLDEIRECVVETVRERKRRPPFAVRAAAAGTDVFEKSVRRSRGWRLCES